MCTTRSLLYDREVSVWGVSLTETPLERDPPLDRDPPRQRSPWTETPLDRDPPGDVTCGACWDRDSPCGQNSWHTLVTTLPCRNFVAGGKNLQNRNIIRPFNKQWLWLHMHVFRKGIRWKTRYSIVSSSCNCFSHITKSMASSGVGSPTTRSFKCKF